MKYVIIGPRSVGKSTTSKLFAKRINLKYLSSDDLMDEYFKQFGGLDAMIKSGKIKELMIKGTEVIEDVLKGNNFVLDLAGGSISAKKGYELGVCQRMIKAIENSIVIGLIPFEDKNESIKHLFARERNRPHFSIKTDDELFAKVKKDFFKLTPILSDVSNHIVYTKGRKVEDIVNEIISLTN